MLHNQVLEFILIVFSELTRQAAEFQAKLSPGLGQPFLPAINGVAVSWVDVESKVFAQFLKAPAQRFAQCENFVGLTVKASVLALHCRPHEV